MDAALERIFESLRLGSLSIEERLILFRAGASEAPLRDTGDRFARWRSTLDTAGVWQERLASADIGESEFAAAVALQAGTTEQVLSASVQATTRDLVGLITARLHPRRPRLFGQGLPPLPPAIQRLVEDRFHALRQGLPATLCRDLGKVLDDEVDYALSELYSFLLPALTTELHVARVRGVLAGETPEERFDSFCRDLLPSPEWCFEFLKTYPVGLRTLDEILRTRVQNLHDLFDRYAADQSVLHEYGLLPQGTTGVIERVRPPSGDRHREGNSVRILELDGGARLVYKPHPVATDLAFQSALRWLGDHGFTPELSIIRIVGRKNYGWVEFVVPADCEGPASVERFYRRQGANLALLYIFGGHDFLADNVRARGEYPVLVDLECLLTPPLEGWHSSAAQRYLSESVGSTGLLPSLSLVYRGKGIDLSPLTLPGPQMTPGPVPAWINRGTDALRQERRPRERQRGHLNLPTIKGVPQPVNEHVGAFRSGFCDAYRILEANKTDPALATVLKEMGEAECRVILRDTASYERLLDSLAHPRYLRDALRASEFLDQLWRSHSPRFSADVLRSEICQLSRRDVPMFTSPASSRDLHDDQGCFLAAGYFAESGLDAARRRLDRLEAKDLWRQLEIMDAAFGSAEIPRQGAGEISISPCPVAPMEGEDPVCEAALLRDAVAIGDQLFELAITDDTGPSWIGIVTDGADVWSCEALDGSLYDGFTGIALFYLWLDILTGKERFRRVWRAIIEHGCVRPAQELLRERKRLPSWVLTQPSAFTYPFSGLYVGLQAQQAGRVEGLDLLMELSLVYAEVGLKLAPKFDFVAGAAGTIRALLVSYRATGEPRALALARAYGEQLRRHAMPALVGVGWPSDSDKLPGLIGGFAHGVSGIAFALADLATEIGDVSLLRLTADALRYDRTLFSAGSVSWQDLRTPNVPGESVQWCHGPAGTGLSRALLSRYFPNEGLGEDVARAVDLTLAATCFSDCICHGTFGNADICLVAAEELGQPAWRASAKENVARGIADAKARGHWRGGVPGHDVSRHGLFMGMAGIGYGLLRLARPDVVSSVLYFEEPRRVLATQHLESARTQGGAYLSTSSN